MAMKNDLQAAATLLAQGEYTCVLCKGQTVYTAVERGVKPLLNFLESGLDFSGFSAADKVIGKAAAFLYVLLRVKNVYAVVVSQAALAVFKQHGIWVQYETAVKQVVNRTGTGPCPMEEAVWEINDPNAALTAIKQRLFLLKNS